MAKFFLLAKHVKEDYFLGTNIVDLKLSFIFSSSSEYIFPESKAEPLCWGWGVWAKFRACPRHDVPGIYIDRNFHFVKLFLQKIKGNHLMKNIKMCKYILSTITIFDKYCTRERWWQCRLQNDNDDIGMGIKGCLSGYGQWGRFREWRSEARWLKHEVSAANTVMNCFNPNHFTRCACYLHNLEVIQSHIFYVLSASFALRKHSHEVVQSNS